VNVDCCPSIIVIHEEYRILIWTLGATSWFTNKYSLDIASAGHTFDYR
jgi:hypothetical protein